ncbi:MAG: hypothetical protein IIB69_00705 [Proteobacteria bacterium]|nr:hypothetical protein [Pseudomonadota bacterium]
MTTTQQVEMDEGPWNPGIQSILPPKYLPLSTLFRPENMFSSIETVAELSDFTGLPIQQLVFFRPERLVVHELLIRVSADIFISDGSKYEDLGVNFRKVVATILSDYIEQALDEIIMRFYQLKKQIESLVEQELDDNLFDKATRTEQGQSGFSLTKFFKLGGRKTNTEPIESVEMRDQRILSDWRIKAEADGDRQSEVLYQSLVKVSKAIIVKHGRLVGDRSLLKSLVTGFACNEYGSELIGELIAPYITEAAAREGYSLLPPQTEPIVINIKGASASGKSTMRPRQQKQTEKLGLNWQEFALISPDIWRKYLLDYDSLGPAYKYAGTLAGDEIPIIDQKLDRYISAKAEQDGISHLLIDRFRFDSFAPGRDTEKGSNLLTRFGHIIYLTFMVTPPEATVERAWKRGLQVGRFKAVDDLLDHNIEAFKGMPVLFFTWVLRKDKKVFYEFLDNSVANGQKPRTIAFGLNGEMYILDFKCMLDIVRYTRININAHSPAEVYSKECDLNVKSNSEFLIQCAQKITKINFVDRESEQVYACMEAGRMCWLDPELMYRILKDKNANAGFEAIAPGLLADIQQVSHEPARAISSEARRHIMGALSKKG